MAKKAPVKTVEIEPITANLAVNTTASDLQTLLFATKEDFTNLGLHSRKAAEYALRIGVRLYCISLTRGALTAFIKLCKPVEGMSERQLYRFKEMAEGFLEQTGFIDKRKHVLKDNAAVTPLLSEQLELWAPDREDAVGKAMRWIADRSVTEILRGLAEEKMSKKDRLTGAKRGNKHASITPDREREIAIEHSARSMNSAMQYFSTDVFHRPNNEGARPSLADLMKMSSPVMTYSLLTSEVLTNAMGTLGETIESIKHLIAEREAAEKPKRRTK